jgi:hypothetical protein
VLTDDLIVAHSPGVRWRRDGPLLRHVAVSSPATGAVHLLNPSAAEIFTALDGAHDLLGVRTLLAARYRVPAEIFARDFASTVSTLIEAGFCHICGDECCDRTSDRTDGREGRRLRNLRPD